MDVKTCKQDSNLDDVAGLMWRYDCGAIPVIDEQNKPIGIITDRDIAMAAMLNHKPLWSLNANDLIRNQKLDSCQQNDSVQACLDKMQEDKVRRILVTNADGTLAGIVSLGDVVSFTGNSAAKGAKGAKPKARVDVEPVLNVLKQVSAHRKQEERPLARTNSS